MAGTPICKLGIGLTALHKELFYITKLTTWDRIVALE
jgi:hypothetical protein